MSQFRHWTDKPVQFTDVTLRKFDKAPTQRMDNLLLVLRICDIDPATGELVAPARISACALPETFSGRLPDALSKVAQ